MSATIVITGGAGFIGREVTKALLARGQVRMPDGSLGDIGAIRLLDVAPGPDFGDKRVTSITADATDAASVRQALDGATSVFHLAAVVSAGAEADFDLGYKVNLDGTRLVLEEARRQKTPPRVVFTSSVAVFGGDLPEVVLDSTSCTPSGSYGAQKAMGELLVADYARKGFCDGRSVRLPTIVVRPGKPNKAASSFASGILREPLQGEEAICPVGPDTRLWILSPRGAVRGLIDAHEMDAARWGSRAALNIPGLSVTVEEMLTALEAVAGKQARARVKIERDPKIEPLVLSWPGRFDPSRALALGFTADPSMEAIVQSFIEDYPDRKAA